MWQRLLGIGIALAQAWDPARIQIYRDSLGVAHVWAPTDAEAAYGMGWAQAEDVPEALQYNLLAARGQLGRVLGKEGAVWDFLLHFAGIDTMTFRHRLDPTVWHVIEGFVAGVNAYFAAHPEKQLVRGLFPATAEDVARGAHLILNVMGDLGRAVLWTRKGFLSDIVPLVEGYGSNAWAVASHRSADGATWLLLNSHQPLEGRFAWYEIHVGSAEGWNLTGGTFPGGPFPFVGANAALGWAHTNAYHNLTDIYELTVRRGKYRFGGEWLPLEKRKARLRVKGLPFPLTRKVYRSAFGPTLKIKGRWYAFGQLTYSEGRALEEWYRMGKARSFPAFVEALRLHALPCFNTTYADCEGHIALFSWVLLPERDTTLRWDLPIRDPSPAHRIQEKVPVEALPQVIDPPCGYVYNANQTPLQATCPAAQWHPTRKLIGLQRFTYNRGERLAELWPRYDGRALTWEDLKTLKHDRCIASEGSYKRVFAPLFQLSPDKYPALREAIEALRRWAGCAEPHDTLTALVMVTHAYLEKKMGLRLVEALILGYPPTEKEVIGALRQAVKVLKKHYGTLYPRWDKVLRHGRGGVAVGVGGFPEALEARHWRWDPHKGYFKVTGGDGLIYWMRWKDGQVSVWGIQPYGASHVPGSPHYTDQVEAFAAGRLFERLLDWERVRQGAVKVYSPQ
ncbi:MAG: penicillin acylase family protein [Bacteroidia bacterium]|nr:penicillin acylase family protein [Bacteroidia bacterium]